MYSTQLGVDGSGFMFDQRVGVILDCVGIDCGERLSPLNIYFHFSYIHCNPILNNYCHILLYVSLCFEATVF